MVTQTQQNGGGPKNVVNIARPYPMELVWSGHKTTEIAAAIHFCTSIYASVYYIQILRGISLHIHLNSIRTSLELCMQLHTFLQVF